MLFLSRSFNQPTENNLSDYLHLKNKPCCLLSYAAKSSSAFLQWLPKNFIILSLVPSNRTAFKIRLAGSCQDILSATYSSCHSLTLPNNVTAFIIGCPPFKLTEKMLTMGCDIIKRICSRQISINITLPNFVS